MKRILFIFLLIAAGAAMYWLRGSDVTENIDTYVYDLPFKKGTAHGVIQGYGELFSRKNVAALDFYMPVGTPVYAAREGTLYGYKDDSDEGGPFSKYEKKADYIIIRHADGSFGCYWHLKQNGVLIKSGAVRKGELIGYSGETGFVLGPHLHFSVKRILNYSKDAYVRTKFMTTAGVQLLKNGGTYSKP